MRHFQGFMNGRDGAGGRLFVTKGNVRPDYTNMCFMVLLSFMFPVCSSGIVSDRASAV